MTVGIGQQTLTFLGTGTSFGVPQVGCECAVCASEDPRDKRTRVGAVVESRGARILIDTPPELRMQLISCRVAHVDAVLYTHDHADHTHGLDDVRGLASPEAGTLRIYGPSEAIESVRRKFAYVFDSVKPIPGTSKPEAELHTLAAGEPVTIAGQTVTPFDVPHGNMRVFAYRVGDVGYVTDAKELPAAALAILRGVKVLVLNALFRRPHPTHLSISEAVETAKTVGAARTYLTHLTHRIAHAELEAELPDGIRPAFDGLRVTVS
ncbi:MAG: MBL fold metallo-hydrolase [Gemmatimonadetes bacterium]|nr:MBL fold metallo-hydrolase [Gemmatimonadota bacterium]